MRFVSWVICREENTVSCCALLIFWHCQAAMSLLESWLWRLWSAGKPVVATLAGGPREYIWHDVNGFLVDTNAGGLAHGIGSLLADHDHCRALGHNGRVAVEDNTTGTQLLPIPRVFITIR